MQSYFAVAVPTFFSYLIQIGTVRPFPSSVLSSPPWIRQLSTTCIERPVNYCVVTQLLNSSTRPLLRSSLENHL